MVQYPPQENEEVKALKMQLTLMQAAPDDLIIRVASNGGIHETRNIDEMYTYADVIDKLPDLWAGIGACPTD